MAKTRRAFDDSLSLYSLWGFIALAMLIFLKIDLSAWQTSILLGLAGAGLMMEGNILSVRKWARDGVNGNEVTWMLSIIVGAFALIVAVLKLPFIALVGPKIDTVVGLVSVFAAVFIAAQRWWFD